MTDTDQTPAPVTAEDADDTRRTVFVPLNKLRKSPAHVRKVPHGEDFIAALAASIAQKGLYQNLVIEPEMKNGKATGFYLVTAGEARRLAFLLRAKRKEIAKTYPVRCWLDSGNDAREVSLDENYSREALHPADEVERFHELSRDNGWSADEIALRYRISPAVVRQRLRLGAVSPALLDAYRQGDLTLEQLAAFTLTDDHGRQEQVFDSLPPHRREPWIIRQHIVADKVPASDRRAMLIGAEAYAEAGGHVARDLFTEDGGGFFEDAGLLDRLVVERLNAVAADVLAEGWKWAEASIAFPSNHGFRRCFPESVALSAEDEVLLAQAIEAHEALTDAWPDEDGMPEDVAAKVAALATEMDAIAAKRNAYDPEMVARAGVFVSLGFNGAARIERGYIRPEDEFPADPDPEDGGDDAGDAGDSADEDGEGGEDDAGDAADDSESDAVEDTGGPLPDSLIRDLTAHRTLGLRLALGEQPEWAMIALTHALVLDLFFYGASASCLGVRADSAALDSHADGIADTPAGVALAARHDRWAARVPDEEAEVWAFVASLDGESRTALLAHCVAMTVDAVKSQFGRSSTRIKAADALATAVGLDMGACWTPTVRSYFGRITKARIAQAVGEAVSPETAARILPLKKPDMAQAAEALVAGTGWLPALLRTAGPVEDAPPAEAVAPEDDGAEISYAIAAE